MIYSLTVYSDITEYTVSCTDVLCYKFYITYSYIDFNAILH